ncbi:MAG: hypothetical protein AUH11_11310 [Acidobacteria bacterium 13_2_20CM_57_17]|nr:MAG: hypothetical protein AUH11_11310 [Acidobacteria bacterium 13_2_20CM_57_17]
MKKSIWIALISVALVLSASTFFGYRKWSVRSGTARDEALALMPSDASAILFVNFSELRRTLFITQLYAWAPKPQADADYAQFVKDSGFDYERDLDRMAIAVVKHGQDSSLFAILDGKLDRQKISAYALKDGSSARVGGHETFSVPISGNSRKVSFAFLTNDRIAVTNDSDLTALLGAKSRPGDVSEWRARFERLTGSPVFAVFRQDAAVGTALAAQAPGGLRSPQLSTLLDQLQWITLAGKPESNLLRVVAEGECTAEASARQLVDVVNGVVILAEGGLNDPKVRKQLDPAMRDAYLALLKSADVSKIDRGETKSVRLVFEITPGFLEAAGKAPSVIPDSTPNKRLPEKVTTPRKGHT